MSSADEQTQKASQLIERLLVDGPFRAAFRKDPAGACRELGLGDLAEELGAGGGKSMHTLELRESKSSLAGVVMAVAAEGIGVVELHGMVEHGLLKGSLRGVGERALRGVNPLHPASSLHSELRSENPLSGASRNPLGTAERGAELARGAEQSAGGPSSGSAAAASPGSPGAAAPGGGAAGTAAPGGSAAGAGGPGASAAATQTPGGSGPAAASSAAGGGGGSGAGASSVSGAGGGGAAQAGAPTVGSGSGAAQAGGSGGGAAPWPTTVSGGGAAQAGAATPGAGGGVAQTVTPTPGAGGGVVQAGTPTPGGGGGVVQAGTPTPSAGGGGVAQTVTPTPGTGSAAEQAGTPTPSAAEAQAGTGGAGGGGVGGAGAPIPPPEPPSPGAQPAAGGAVPVWPEPAHAPGGAGAAAVAQVTDLPGQVSAGGTGAGLAELLDNPHLAMPPGVRAIFAHGAVDPRMVSVLDNAVAHHNIVIGDIETSTEPVHAQAIDIISVDGQPVGPSNVAARDLITEIAAMEPDARPNEIGTPWPIQSQGFFTDAQHVNRLHLAFTSPGDYQASPVGAQAVGAAPGAPSALDSAAGTPGEVGAVAEAPGSGVASSAGVVSAAPGGPLPAISSSAAEALAGPQARTGGGASTALAWAHSMLHRLPESEGENVGPSLNRFEASFGFHGAPWCGIFVGHALEHAGLKVPDSIASVASILDMASHGEGPFEKGILPVSAIRPGDLVTFGGSEHVAMVVKVDGEGIHTIAGNYENNVTEHTYAPGEVTGVVRPRYDAALPQASALGGAPGDPSSPPVVPSAAPALGAAAVPGPAAAEGVSAAGSPAPGADSAAATAAESPGGAQLAGASPSQPDTGVFRAAAPRPLGSHHTVKFLQAVQPPSSSPPPGQAPGGAPAAQPAGTPTVAGAPGSASAAEASPGSGGGVDAAAGALDGASSGMIPYPGDNAPKAELAQWMGDLAQKHGLPRELPVMASLVESSLHNDNFGDRDSLGYFQMRTSIWDNGQYAGYPNDPSLQVKWFIDQALAVKNQMPERHFGSNPANYGEWIDEIERPAEEYRGRYQLQLSAAQELLGRM